MPEALLRAIDRMLPMVRLFRHGDGTLSHFNGMGVTAADHLATLLTYDDMRSQPIHHAPYSGYERLEAGRSLVVADVGACPPAAFAAEAAASCLSFEFSSGRSRIIVNCGAPAGGKPCGDRGGPFDAPRTRRQPSAPPRRACSSHAEGGAVTRFLAGWLLKRLGPVALAGARDGVRRTQRARPRPGRSTPAMTATAPATASRIERRLRLSADGQWLEGEDRFSADQRHCGRGGGDPLPPRPGRQGEPRRTAAAVMLRSAQPGGLAFRGEPGRCVARGQHVLLPPDGARRTEQIVLRLKSGETRTCAGASSGFSRARRRARASARSEPSPELL